MAKKQWYAWTVEFKVHRTWVEDGFDMTDERALDMLSHDLGYATPLECSGRAEVGGRDPG